MDVGSEALIKLEAHEKECLVRYTNIQKTLDDHHDRFDKLENKAESGFKRIENLLMYGGTFFLTAIGVLIALLGFMR